MRGAIAHTQPRRLAARTVAERIADELKVPLGSAVGYAVRFTDKSGENTLLRLCTDGLLLAEIQNDRLLRRYDTIIVDEAHERSLNIDFLLGYLKRLLPAAAGPEGDRHVARRSTRSASPSTSTTRRSSRSAGAPTRSRSATASPRRTPTRPTRSATRSTSCCASRPGDILVFLSGEREIRDTAEALEGRFNGVEILPLFARQSTAAQQRVWKPHKGRRVVLATNVAETSLTVPGIRYVVDPGTARISRYSARLKVQRLPIEPISQASADQRKGRCGRVADGIAIRLFSEENFEERPRFTDPEILRTSLAAVILQMAAIDLGDIEDFPFLDPPDRRQVRDGIALLQELGALDETGRMLTQLGRRLAAAADRPADGPDGARGRRAGLRGGGDRDRRRALDPGRARAARRPAGPGRPGARPPRRRELRLPRLLEPVALPARAARRAVREPVPQAGQGRVPALPADPRVAGPRRPDPPGRQGRSGSRATTRRPSRSRSTRRSSSGLLSHLGLKDAGRREYIGARNARSRCGRARA